MQRRPRFAPAPAPLREAPEACHLISKLRELYPSPEWALFSEVRSSVGAVVEIDTIRRADALAVRAWGPAAKWSIRGFEVKRSRSDWLRELAQPEKAAAISRFCETWTLVVPAPSNRIVLSVHELPEGVGLIEIGAGVPRSIVPAIPRKNVERPTDDFLKALLRVAAARIERADLDDAPPAATSDSKVLPRRAS
jgi:hypothetical protein